MAHKNRRKIEEQKHRGPTFHGFRPSIEEPKTHKAQSRKQKHKRNLAREDEEQRPGAFTIYLHLDIDNTYKQEYNYKCKEVEEPSKYKESKKNEISRTEY